MVLRSRVTGQIEWSEVLESLRFLRDTGWEPYVLIDEEGPAGEHTVPIRRITLQFTPKQITNEQTTDESE